MPLIHIIYYIYTIIFVGMSAYKETQNQRKFWYDFFGVVVAVGYNNNNNVIRHIGCLGVLMRY